MIVYLDASALVKRYIAEPVTLATFDLQLWQSGKAADLAIWPEDLMQLVGGS
jgi:predicted nucleic acid-binding protein